MKIHRQLLALLSSALLFGSAANSRADSDEGRVLITRGEYVAQLGDCVACHTADKGATMAGGR
ncbi:MAG: cytochrome c, partial [Acidobacteriota bacterium]|nr:cytochrome c [Acidobacteriota bacterium]